MVKFAQALRVRTISSILSVVFEPGGSASFVAVILPFGSLPMSSFQIVVEKRAGWRIIPETFGIEPFATLEGP